MKLRLTLEIEYEQNGVSVDTLMGWLSEVPMIAWREGVFTKDSEAEAIIMRQEIEEVTP